MVTASPFYPSLHHCNNSFQIMIILCNYVRCVHRARAEQESENATGCIKKMSDSEFNLKSVPGVGFYFFRGVLDSEFRA